MLNVRRSIPAVMTLMMLVASMATVGTLGAEQAQPDPGNDWHIRDDGASWDCYFSCGQNGPEVYPWCACYHLPDIIV